MTGTGVRLLTVAFFAVGWFGVAPPWVSSLLLPTRTPKLQWPAHYNNNNSHDEAAVTCAVHPPLAAGAGHGRRYHEVVVLDPPVLDQDTQRQLEDWMAQRAVARWDGDYARADELRQEILRRFSSSISQSTTDGHSWGDTWRIVLHDIPRQEGGGSTWSLVYRIPFAVAESTSSSACKKGVLQLAHSALGLAVAFAERGLATPQDQLETLVKHAVEQLEQWNQIDQELRSAPTTTFSAAATNNKKNEMGLLCVSFDKLQSLLIASGSNNHDQQDRLASWSAVELNLTGRKAADAAFWFAMAGAQDPDLFALLTNVCVKELQRFGERPSCRIRDVYQIVERLAAAGIQGDDRLEAVVQQCLTAKGMDVKESGSSTKRRSLLDLHSDHSALLLWKFSSRLKKQKAFLHTAAKHWEASSPSSVPDNNTNNEALVPEQKQWDWGQMFDDPTRPLVCDLGCGMGVSLLGLASLKHNVTRDDEYNGDDLDWPECNFLGVDLSHLTINYAKSIARRWNIHGKAAFVVDSAESLLQRLKSYPGRVLRILIQFPTPYRFPGSTDTNSKSDSWIRAKEGNSQLPRTVEDGFMVNPTCLRYCADVLCPISGKLLLQSNCEDVAVWMRSTACETAGFVCQDPSCSVAEVAGTPTQRTLSWVSMGGERARGPGWSGVPILPRTGRTETEISCTLNDRPVHRCILRPC